MSKVIIIDNEKWIKGLKEICDSLGLESFPNDPDRDIKKFHKLRNLIYCSMNGCEREEDVRKTVAEMLSEFIAGEEDYVFIIDYQLRDGNPDINGLKFYELFAKGQTAIFMSATENLKEVEKIQHFCNDSSNCIFISKCDDDWENALKEILTN